MVTRVVCGLLCLGILAGCTEGPGTPAAPAPEMSLESLDNPNVFNADLRNGVMTGAYNPQGFKATEVRAALDKACQSKRLNGYSEAVTESGLMTFLGQCNEVPPVTVGEVKVERKSAGQTTVALSGSLSGYAAYLTYRL